MLAERRGDEPNAVTRRDDPHSQLDVFDARIRKALPVEPAELEEDVTAHQPDSGPEGRGVAVAVLVHVVMPEIRVEAGRPKRCGFIVVRPERAFGAMSLHVVDQSSQAIRRDDHVRIDEPQQVRLRNVGRCVSRKSRALGRAAVLENLRSRITGDLLGPIRCPVYVDQHLGRLDSHVA